MYTVVGAPASRAMRVIWMLEELEQPYTLIPAKPRSEEILSYNQTGKVPALLVGDDVLVDSVAIIQFIADRHGAFTYPAGTIERARQDALTQFCVDEVEGALWTAAKNRFVLPEEQRVPAIKETCRYEFAVAMERLGARLGDGPFVMGEEITVPDILLGHCAGWARSAKFDIPDGPVRDYFRRLVTRPAFQRADAHRKG